MSCILVRAVKQMVGAIDFSNTGKQAAVFHVYDKLNLDRIPKRYIVEPNKTLDDEWDAFKR